MTQFVQGICCSSRCDSSSKFRLNIFQSQIHPFHRIGRKIKTKSEYINLAILGRSIDALDNFEVRSMSLVKRALIEYPCSMLVVSDHFRENIKLLWKLEIQKVGWMQIFPFFVPPKVHNFVNILTQAKEIEFTMIRRFSNEHGNVVTMRELELNRKLTVWCFRHTQWKFTFFSVLR